MGGRGGVRHRGGRLRRQPRGAARAADDRPQPLDFHVVRASIRLVANTLHDRRVFLAIMAISFFWTIGAVLFIQFPPLGQERARRQQGSRQPVPGGVLVGVALGSISINALLKGRVSARYSTGSVILMAGFVVTFYAICGCGPGTPKRGCSTSRRSSLSRWRYRCCYPCSGSRFTGGMFVVPLYAFLTTFVERSQTARTVAANNIVNSGAMVGGSLLAVGLSAAGVAIVDQLLLSAAMCLVSAWLARLLYRAESSARPATL
jgi:hypothetical protein